VGQNLLGCQASREAGMGWRYCGQIIQLCLDRLKYFGMLEANRDEGDIAGLLNSLEVSQYLD